MRFFDLFKPTIIFFFMESKSRASSSLPLSTYKAALLWSCSATFDNRATLNLALFAEPAQKSKNKTGGMENDVKKTNLWPLWHQLLLGVGPIGFSITATSMNTTPISQRNAFSSYFLLLPLFVPNPTLQSCYCCPLRSEKKNSISASFFPPNQTHGKLHPITKTVIRVTRYRP